MGFKRTKLLLLDQRYLPHRKLCWRGSPPTASETSSAPWLAVLVASNAGPTEGVWFVWSPSNFQGHHPAHRSQSKSPTLCPSNRLCMQPTQFRRTAAHICGRAASQSNQQGPALEGGWTAYLDWLLPANPPLLQRDRCLAPNEARICRLSCWKTSQETRKVGI